MVATVRTGARIIRYPYSVENPCSSNAVSTSRDKHYLEFRIFFEVLVLTARTGESLSGRRTSSLSHVSGRKHCI